MADDLVRALIAFFAIIDPVGNLLVFHILTERLGHRHRAEVAALGSATALAVLAILALTGRRSSTT